MVNEIRTIYPCGLKKRFVSKFHVGSRVRHETPEETLGSHHPKRREYNTEDKSKDTLNNENYQALSKKIRQMI